MPDVTFHDALGGHGTNSPPACAISVGDQLVVTIFNLSNTAAPTCAGWTQRATTTDGGNSSWCFTKDALAVSGDIGAAIAFTFAGTLSSFVVESYGNVGSIGNAGSAQVYGGSTWTASSLVAAAAGAAYVIGIMGLDPVTAGSSGTTKRANGDSGITYEMNAFDKLGLAAGATGALVGSMGSGSLEYQFVGVILEPSVGGGTDTPMTISATSTQTPSYVRALGLARPLATIAQTATRIRALARFLAALVSQTLTRVRGVGKTGSSTVTLTTGSAPTIGADFTLSATTTQTPSRTRAVAATKAGTVTGTATRLRDVARALAALVTGTGSYVSGQGFFRTASATATQTPSRTRAVAVAILATVTQTPSGLRALALALLAAVTQTLTRTRALFRSASATDTGTPTQDTSGGGSHTTTAAATVAQTADRARALGLARGQTNAQTPSRLRDVARAVTATQVQTVTETHGRGFFRTAVADVLQSAARLLGFGLERLATLTQTVSLRRDLARTRSATQTLTATATRATDADTAPQEGDRYTYVRQLTTELTATVNPKQ